MSESDSTPEDGIDEPDLTMTLDMNILQHLGLKMYTSLPAVISEYVANAWDAGATEVDIDVPTDESMSDDYEITIEDNGIGMDYDEVEEKFLVVGRNRRQDEEQDVVDIRGMTRPVMGRKGIGKLAGFGVAGKVVIQTFKDGKHVEFELDYDQMKERGNEADPADTSTYDPEVTDYGSSADKDHGTIVTLTDLNRERRPTTRYIKERLARRFSVIDEDFVVRVNGERIEPSDRGLRRKCSYVEEYDEQIEDSEGNQYPVKGWIGTMEDPVESDEQKGVAVMARGKLVQEPTFLGVSAATSGQFALEYVVGEIHADFVDREDLDLISTDRSSLAWGKEPATQLREWIKEELVNVADAGAEKRSSEATKAAKETESYDDRITSLPDDKQEEIDEFIGKAAQHRDFESGEKDEFIEKVADSAEREVFTDFITDMQDVDVADTDAVFDLFDRWEVIDALELMQVARGRLETISKFRSLIDSDAQNEEYVHDFISENPWVMEPRWDYVDDEPKYSDEIKEQFPAENVHDNPDTRLKILCLGYGENLNIVEIMSPSDTIERRHLSNLELYVDHLRSSISEQDDLYRSVSGYVIGGEVSEGAAGKIKRLESDDLYGRTYERMQDIAENTFDQFLEVFREKAQKTGDERLLNRVESLEEEAAGD
ncbi:ATP-binding protein [Halobacterium rubrum]|uniref:ATP-binding protein n=1 Tax=Halobacterium TaxID=2239 RepID=UPI001F427F84|nr:MULTISPECIES: ATP-binding protein [Halobacterium]MDH5019017.1 ATP-binding protein [Halobacterium rubrum]